MSSQSKQIPPDKYSVIGSQSHQLPLTPPPHCPHSNTLSSPLHNTLHQPPTPTSLHSTTHSPSVVYPHLHHHRPSTHASPAQLPMLCLRGRRSRPGGQIYNDNLALQSRLKLGKHKRFVVSGHIRWLISTQWVQSCLAEEDMISVDSPLHAGLLSVIM